MYPLISDSLPRRLSCGLFMLSESLEFARRRIRQPGSVECSPRPSVTPGPVDCWFVLTTGFFAP